MHNLLEIGGEGGDRTHGPVARTAVFETARFGHSRTSPLGKTRPPAGKSMGEIHRRYNQLCGQLTLKTVIFQLVFFEAVQDSRYSLEAHMI